MTRFMSGRIGREVEARLGKLANPVSLLYFARSGECGTCAAQQALLEEVTALSEKLALEVFDLVADSDQAVRFGIEKAPATAVLGYFDYGIRFYGLTAGYQFASLLEAIMMAAGDRSGLAPEIASAARALRTLLHLEIVVSLRCPYSGALVRRAHQLAVVNRNIVADMVNAVEFPGLLERYGAASVPLVIVNGRPFFAATAAADTTPLPDKSFDSLAAALFCTCGAGERAAEWGSAPSEALWLEPPLHQLIRGSAMTGVGGVQHDARHP